jgi:RHS repeat-associated protein
MPTTFGNQPIRSGSELPIYDAQGNQRAITASNQTVTGTQIFDAFGNKVAATGSTASALQWQGTNLYRTYTPDAGLLQAGARYYDPQVGRFVTRDTVLSQHPYIYCNGDPVNRSDPNGHENKAFTDLGNDIMAIGAVTAGIGLGTSSIGGEPLIGLGGIWAGEGGAIYLIGRILPSPGPNPPSVPTQIGNWVRSAWGWFTRLIGQ